MGELLVQVHTSVRLMKINSIYTTECPCCEEPATHATRASIEVADTVTERDYYGCQMFAEAVHRSIARAWDLA